MPKTHPQLKRKVEKIISSSGANDPDTNSKEYVQGLIEKISDLEIEVSRLRSRLAEMEETLDAIRSGAVDALVINGPEGESIYSLAGAEHPYRVMVETMGEGAVALSADGAILYANSSFARLLKMPLEKIAGSDFSQHIFSRDRAKFRAALRQGGKLEVSLSSRDRAQIPVYLSITPLEDESAPGHFSLVVTDLTHQKNEEILRKHSAELELEIEERKAIQRQLQQARNIQHAYIDSAPAAIIVVDFSGKVLLANSLVESILGEKLRMGSQMLQKSRNIFFLPDGSPAPLSSLPYSQALAGYDVKNVELVVKRSNGSESIVLANATPLKTNYGSIWGAITVLQDITELKRVEEDLKKFEERFRVAQELSPDGFTILRPLRDKEGSVVDFTWVYENQAVARKNGTDPNKVVGKRLLDLFPGHRGNIFFDTYRHVAETGKSCVIEAEYGRDIPKPTWFRLAVVSMGNDIAVLAQDITEHKRDEEALRKSKDELEDKVRERTALYAEANNNLLAEIAERKRTEEILRAAQENLRRMTADIIIAEEKARQKLATTLHDTVVQTMGAAKLRSQLIQDDIPEKAGPVFSQMQNLISESITQARSIMAEMIPPVLNELGLVPALEWLAEQFESRHGIKVNFRSDAESAPPNREVQVLMFQATQELLNNTLKHARADRVTVRFCDNRKRFSIEVKDNGLGFDAKKTMQPDSNGGFGLYSIRERLRYIDGSLSIKSKPGRGATVTITAPKRANDQIAE